ncbi:hypothetical protein Tco_0793349 [Tanacetum coccineum]
MLPKLVVWPNMSDHFLLQIMQGCVDLIHHKWRRYTSELDESMLDALGILKRKQHKKLLLKALVGEDSGEEQLFASKNCTSKEGSDGELNEFLTDMADLQCLPLTIQPRVSDHMDVRGDPERHKTFLWSFIDRTFLLQRLQPTSITLSTCQLAFPNAVLEHKYIKLICTGYLDSATEEAMEEFRSNCCIALSCPFEQEVAAIVERMEKAARYTSNKYVEVALNSTTVVLPYLVPVSCFSSLYFAAGSLLILLLGLREINAAFIIMLAVCTLG